MKTKEDAVRVTDPHLRKLLEEFGRHGQIGLASLRAGMDRKTGRKYVALGELPSVLKTERSWRTVQVDVSFGVRTLLCASAC